MAEGRRFPFGGGVVVDRKRLLDLIDQLRAAVPEDVRQATALTARRDEVIAEAEREASRLLARAEEELQRRVSEHEVLRAAERQGERIIREAEEQGRRLLEQADAEAAARLEQAAQVANQQMEEADRYALELLRRLDAQLSAFVRSVRNGIASLEQPRQGTAGGGASALESAQAAAPSRSGGEAGAEP